MQTRRTTNRTAEAIRQAIQDNMNENRCRQVFMAVAELGGAFVIVAPEADGLQHGPEFKGYIGIQRHAWDKVPGYAERIADCLEYFMNH